MSKRSYFVLFIMLLFVLSIAADANSSISIADKLINEHIRARGGYKKIKAITSLRMTGTYQEGKNTFGTSIEWRRPDFRVVVVGVPDEVYREG